jgi:hypothetical protein
MAGGPGDDPLLRAGTVDCRACRRVAFPTDATMLGGGWIVASFPRPCQHIAAGTVLIDLRDAEVPAGASAPLHELARYVPGRRCAGRNRKSRPCRSYAAPGSDYCRAHDAAGKPA